MNFFEKLGLSIFIFGAVYAFSNPINSSRYLAGATVLLIGWIMFAYTGTPNKSLNADVANRPEEITPEMLTSTVMYLRDLKKFTEVNEHYWLNDPEELENIIQTLTRHAG